LVSVKEVANFMVIEIVDKKDIYPKLLGFKWVNNNEAIIILKIGRMSFEANGTGVIQPIDHMTGERYIEPMDDVMDGLEVD
jgi:hypothetical protein